MVLSGYRECNSLWLFALLSPSQTESQVDASWKPGCTCDSVWPGLARTCVELRWTALTLAGRDKICMQTKAIFSPFGHPTQVKANWVTYANLLLVNEIEDSLRQNVFFFATCVYLRGNMRVRLAAQRKSRRKFKLRHLRLLGGPFGHMQGFTMAFVSSWNFMFDIKCNALAKRSRK